MIGKPSTELEQWTATVLLLVLAAVAGFRGFVSGKLSPFFGDLRFTHWPLIHAGARRDGGWPLWSDHIFNGYPIFADLQAAQYYPPTWFVRWWGDPSAFTAILLLHVVIAGIGMVVWLRGHGFGWPAQLLGALAFALSGAFLNLGVHLGLFTTVAWIPLWLACIHRVVKAPSTGAVSLAGLVLAAAILAGGPQLLAAAVLLTGFYGVGLFVRHRAQWRGRALVERSASVIATVLVGAGVGAIALLPQLELVPLSQRSIGLELEFAAQPSLAPHALWRLVVGPTVPRPDGVEGDPLELYLGTVTVVLALVGLITALAREHRREQAAVAVALAGCTVLLMTASLGQALPVFRNLVEWVPGFAYFRAPSRLICIAGIGVGYLAALGLELWMRGAVSRRLLVTVTALIVLGPTIVIATSNTYGGDAAAAIAIPSILIGLAALLFGDRHRANAGLVIVAVTVLDLAILAAPKNPFAQRADSDAEQLALHSLDWIAEHTDDPVDARVIITKGYGYGTYNHTMLAGLDGVSGYNGSSLLRFLDVMHLIEHGRFHPRTGLYRDEIALTPRRFDTPLVDMLGAPYLVGRKTLAPQRYKFVRRLYADHRTELIFANPHAVPRAYLSTKTIVAPTLAEREAALLRLDPSRETVVEDPSLQLDGPARIEPVALERRRSEHLILRCETEHRALLVITDSHYPGWRATVDGVETPIAVVNHVFRGVLLEPGAHTVELVFRPRSYEIGWRLTVTMLVLLAGGAVWRRWRARPRAARDGSPAGR